MAATRNPAPKSRRSANHANLETQVSMFEEQLIKPVKLRQVWPICYRTEYEYEKLLNERLAAGQNVGFDIETTMDGTRGTHLGIGFYMKDHPNMGVCASVPWDRRLARKTVLLTQAAKRKLVGHNALGADKPWTERYLEIDTNVEDWYDTMLTHYVCNMHLTRLGQKQEDDDEGEGSNSGVLGLMDLWSAVRCLPILISSWKDCRGEYSCGVWGAPCPRHQRFRYNGTDAWGSSALEYYHNLEFEENKVPASFIEHIHDVGFITYQMQKNGIRIDTAYVDNFVKEWSATVQALAEKLPFNPKSEKQILEYFLAIDKTLPTEDRYRLGNTRKETIQKALEASSDAVEGFNELQLLFDIKNSGKGADSWFEKKYFVPHNDLTQEERKARRELQGTDYRYVYIHPRFNSTGTATLRLSSSNPNAQNIPSKGPLAVLRRAIIAPPGYKVVKADAKQLEVRVLLYDYGVDNRKIVSLDPFTDLVKLGKGVFEHTADILNTNPTAAKKWKARDIAKSVAHGCLLPSAEVYTRQGWRNIFNVSLEEEIAVWDNGKITFEVPKRKFIYDVDEELLYVRGNSIDCIFTKNHKMPTTNRKSNIVHKYDVDSLPKSHSLFLTGELDNPEYPISDDDIRRAVAIQADGSLTGNKARFRLKKQRKIERIKSLFLERKENIREGVYECSVKNISELINPDKTFSRKILNFSLRQRLIFIEELFKWDGSYGKNKSQSGGKYSNTKFKDISLVAEVAAISGYTYSIQNRGHGGYPGSKLINYDIYLSNTHKLARISNLEIRSIQYKGKVYCFETSTGYFMCRSNGKVFVSGNSTNGEGLELATASELESKRMRTLEEKGAIRVFRDWQLGDKFVYSTGSNLARRIFGRSTDENRKLALDLLFDGYYVMIPQIPLWHRKVSYEVFETNQVRGLGGSILHLDHPSLKERIKAAYSVKTQGGGAYFMRGKMVDDFKRFGRIWTMMVHDEMVTFCPENWSDEEVKNSFSFLEEESSVLPGLYVPFEYATGPNWFDVKVI